MNKNTKHTGVSMQGRMERTKKGYIKGEAQCKKCKHFKFGYYCEKYKSDAHFPAKNKKCDTNN